MTEPTRLTEAELARLLALAALATPGPWSSDTVDRYEEGDEWSRPIECVTRIQLVADVPTGMFEYDEAARAEQPRKDAAYIAAVSPDVVRALVEEVRRLRQETAARERIIEIFEAQLRRTEARDAS